MSSNFIVGLPYFLFFVLFLIFFLFGEIKYSGINVSSSRKSNRELTLFLLICTFAFFIGMRGYVNTDWVNYSKIFKIMDVDSSKNYFEPGFNMIMRFSKKIYDNYFLFVFVSSMVDCFLFYEAFKNEKNIFLCFVFFYIFSGAGAGFRLEFNLMRNVKSILIFAISLKYVVSKNWLRYLFLNLIGILFHISSILYLPVYFFLRKRFSKKLLLIIFFIGNIIFLLQIHWVSSIISNLGAFLPGKLGDLINTYLNIDVYSSEFGISIGYLERFFTFFLVLHFYGRCEDKEIPLYNSLFIYLFIYLFCSEMNILLSRVAILFIVGYWFVFPNIYYRLSKSNKSLYLLILIAYSFMKLIMMDNPLFFTYDNILFSHGSYQERLDMMKVK